MPPKKNPLDIEMENLAAEADAKYSHIPEGLDKQAAILAHMLGVNKLEIRVDRPAK